jgi:hypothetical protein
MATTAPVPNPQPAMALAQIPSQFLIQSPNHLLSVTAMSNEEVSRELERLRAKPFTENLFRQLDSRFWYEATACVGNIQSVLQACGISIPSMEHVMLLSALQSRYFKHNQKCLLCPRASDGPHSGSECPTLRARGEAWRRWQARPPAHQRDPILPDSRTLYLADGDPRSEWCASGPARGHKRPLQDRQHAPTNKRTTFRFNAAQ